MGTCFSTFQALDVPSAAVSVTVFVNEWTPTNLENWNSFPLSVYGSTCNSTEWYQSQNLTIVQDGGFEFQYYYTYTTADGTIVGSQNYTHGCYEVESFIVQNVWETHDTTPTTTSIAVIETAP